MKISKQHARRLRAVAVVAVSLIAIPLLTAAHGAGGSIPFRTASDSADVVATAEQFHAALAAGDSGAALALLGEDVAILESGGAETKADYRSHHLAADIEFARAVPSHRTVTSVRIRGDAAWVTATSTTRGEYRGRQVNSVGAELVVLSRDGGAWKIRAIHWSSRASRAS